MVLFPCVLGMSLNAMFPAAIARIRPYLPLTGALITAVMCAGTTASVAPLLLAHGVGLLPPVILLHFLALSAGLLLASAGRLPPNSARTVALTTGMNSSGLGLLLALRHLGPAVAVPCAVSVVVMTVGGACAAAVFRSAAIQELTSS